MREHVSDYLGSHPDDRSRDWSELEIQSYCVMLIRREGFIVHADGNGLSKTPKGRMQQIVGGSIAGWPDLTVLTPFGRTIYFEMKKDKGVLSELQKLLHAAMTNIGHKVVVIKEKTPYAAFEKIKEEIIKFCLAKV